MAEPRYGLNIGTQNIAISSIGSKLVICEKNAIAVKDKKYVIAYGDPAWEIYEKAPENVEVVFPVANSVISDPGKLGVVLEGLFKKLNNGKLVKGGEFLIAVPTDTTEVEKRAFHELVANSKMRPRSISIMENSVADSIDCGISPSSSKGNLIVNIGADTSDISVISTGGIVLSKTLKFGGNRLNELIINAIRQSEGKLIGMKSAEQLKINLADLDSPDSQRVQTVFARVITSGLPSRTMIPASLVNGAIIESIELITDDVKRVLDKTPPQFTDDIREFGIWLLGGSANLTGIGSFFEKQIGLPVHIPKDPANSTIRGVTKTFSSSKYDSARYYPREKEYI